MSTTPKVFTVVNTSPLLYLHQINCLELLQHLYTTITIPAAVQQELEAGRQQGVDVPSVTQIDWIQIRPIAVPNLVPAAIDLGQGEAEVIALGMMTPGSLLILDDQLGRRIADLYGLKYTGTLGVLIKAKQAGHLASVTETIAKLRQQGMWLSDEIIHQARQLANEL